MLLRKRFMLFLLVLLLVGIPVFAQDTPPVESFDKLYIDDRNGFIMPYPDGWLVQQQVVGQTLYVVATTGNVFDMAQGPPAQGNPVAIIDFGRLTEFSDLTLEQLDPSTNPVRVIQNYLGPEVPSDLPVRDFRGKAVALVINPNERAGFEQIGIGVMLDDDHYVMATIYKALNADANFVDAIIAMMISAIPGQDQAPPPMTPTPTPSNTAFSVKFTAPDQKYTFEYPAVWGAEVTYNPDNGISNLQATVLGTPFVMNSMVIPSPPMPPAQYLAPGGPWLRDSKVELIESEEFDAAGKSGAMISYTTEDSGPVPYTVYAVDLNNGYFALSLLRGGPMDIPVFRVMVKTVLQSFTVPGAETAAPVAPTATPVEVVIDQDAAREAYNEGLNLSNERDYDGAIEPYTRAIEIDPVYAWAYYRRGEAFFMIENFERALEDLNRAIAFDAEFHEAYNQRGRVYEELEHFESAIADYTLAILWYRGRGNPIEYLNNRGIAYRSLGEYTNALEDFDKAIELSPNTTYTFVNRGITYRMMGENLEQALMDLRFYNQNRNTPNVRISEIIAELEQQLGLQPGEALPAEVAAAAAKPLLGIDRDAPVGSDATVIDISEISLLGRWDSPNKDAALMLPREWIQGKTGGRFTAASSEDIIKYEPFTALKSGDFWVTSARMPGGEVVLNTEGAASLAEMLAMLTEKSDLFDHIPDAAIVTGISEIVIGDKPFGMARFSGDGFEGAFLFAMWRASETMRGFNEVVMFTAPDEFSANEETFYAVAGSIGLPEDVRVDPAAMPVFSLDVVPLEGEIWQVLKNFKDEPVPYPIAYQYPSGWVADSSIGVKFAPDAETLALSYFENVLEDGQLIVTVSQVAARVAIFPGESPVQYMVRQGKFDTVSHVVANGEETARGRTIMSNGNLKIELMRSTHDGVMVVVTGYMPPGDETKNNDLLYGMLMSVEPITP